MSVQAEYRQLGKTGLRVSVPILGGMTIGSSEWLPWVLSESESLALLKAAWDNGVNTVDTANVYSNGESERLIAKFMSQNNVRRENMVVMTKINFLVGREPSTFTFAMPNLGDTREFVNLGGLSRTAILSQVDASLERLNTTYIDLLQIHDFDPVTPFEETMRALHDLVQAGKVRYIGACRLKLWQFAAMNEVAEKNGWTTFASIQVEHSLLYRPEELEMFAYCNYKGIGILGFSPLMDGHLARPVGTETNRTKSINGTPYEKPRRACDLEIINRVEELAKKHTWTMSQVALAWSLTKVSSPIVGANNGQRVAQCIPAKKVLSAEEIQYLEQPYIYQAPR
ncbi:Aldo/keto reductase [Fomitopsis serialis]|uniref:Aldo/keto reductase n=1 Tax=Fomitopsis serialis TaxID=139415 RepID=UPI002008406D|nr:Aldo/keto reductase [Neoantrodia serialis]KAH9934344.1 Aldo/keto reductase [Neoantrodia serialis]